MPYLRAFGFVATMAFAFVFLVPVQTLARRYGWRLQYPIQTGFCRAMCRVIGIRVETQGRLPGATPRFVASNHVSWTDIIALASIHPYVFLAKSEVSSWPVLGFLARLQGTVFVSREARAKMSRVNDALAQVMREGRDLVVFAEGTSSDGSQVLPFRAVHFAPLRDLADATQSKVSPTLAPVAIVYSDGERPLDVGWYADMTFLPHLWSLMKRGGVTCHIAHGDAIDNAPGDRKALAASAEGRVRELHAQTVERLRERG